MWIGVVIVVLLALIAFGIAGNVLMSTSQVDSKQFIDNTQLWLGCNGILLFVFILALLIALLYAGPRIEANLKGLVSDTRNAVAQMKNTAASIERLATKMDPASSFGTALQSAVQMLPKQDWSTFLGRVARAVSNPA